MADAPLYHLAQHLVRAVPNWCPGKNRLGRFLLAPFLSWSPASVQDKLGLRYRVPSLAEPIAAGIFTFGLYERTTIKAIIAALPAGGVFVDVGANIGAIGLPVAKLRPRSTVICVEADAKVAEILRSNVAANALPNVRIVQSLVGAKCLDEVAFYRAPDNKFGMGSVGPQFGSSPISLRQTTLVEVMSSTGVAGIDVLKLDVEGAELGVLQGAEALLRSSNPPTIIFEFADWAEARIPSQTPGDAQRLLLSTGYSLFRLNDRRRGKELIAPMTAGADMLLAIPKLRAPRNQAD